MKTEYQAPAVEAGDGRRLVEVRCGRVGVRSWLASRRSAGHVPVVLLHGFAGASESWREVAGALALVRDVYAFDLPGHGATELEHEPGECAFVAWARALDQAFTALCLDRLVLGGYSLGGRLALYYALRADAGDSRPPDARARLAGLVLESASPGIEDERERSARRAADEELAAFCLHEGIERFVQRWEQTPVLAGQKKLSAQSAAELRRIRLGCSTEGLAASLRFHGAGSMPFLGRARFELGVPVLVIAGADDVKYREIAERLCMQLRGARLQILEDAGHSVHLEQPQAFVRHVEQFLSGCDRSPTRTEVKSA